MGLISQQMNPIKVLNRYIKRISEEKIIICSLAIMNGVRKKIRAASRVPIPETEIGIRVIKPTTVKTIERCNRGILVIFAL